MNLRSALICSAVVVLSTTAVERVDCQQRPEFGRAEALREYHSGLAGLLDRVDGAQARLFEDLVRMRGDRTQTPDGASSARLIGTIEGAYSQEPVEAYAVLGTRAAQIILWSQAFQREVLSALADPTVDDRVAALAEAVRVYESRAALALPSVPKNMDVLYGHAYALGFRTAYPDLGGLAWAGHWLRLAATEPLTDLEPGAEQSAGVDTVSQRYLAKLSGGEPPAAFPSELPLAPAIAPGLIWLSPETAVIWDNTSMLLEVLADVLSSPDMPDVEGAIEATLDFFLDPDVAVTDQDEWEIMALRHGIFFQGGFPLAVMTQNERNVGGHAAHLMGGGMLRVIPGMPR